MADVFISYKSERRAATRHLAQTLTCYGYSVWYDCPLMKGALADQGARLSWSQVDREIR
jgi:hypothetical protein